MINRTKRLNRRSFLSSTTCAAALALHDTFFTSICHAEKKSGQNGKKLFATTDYTDNVGRSNCFFNKTQLDELHKTLADLGVTRHQWIVDSIWTLYENYPHKFDLLAEAVKSAHKYGIELYAEIKMFEGGGFGITIPPTMPFPKNAPAFKDMRGIHILARPFAAKHPEMCLKRKSGTYEFKGPLTTVRLIKDDNAPTKIKAGHLSVWTSATNNNFVEYTGPVSFRESVEWRPCFPKWKQCRILHLENLKIPKDHVFVLIRCSLTDESEEFSNENGKILELVGGDGEIAPYILGKGLISYENHNNSLYQSKIRTQLIRYLQLPKVREEIQDSQKMQRHYKDFYQFDEHYNITDTKSLTKDGFIVAACGKPEYMLGNLNPIYPDVREHWMDLTRFCLDRGVDGINFRMANHTRSPEYWEFGFNEPVLKASNGRTDSHTISRINGNAYTQFLRDAKKLIKNKGKKLTLHLHAGMFLPDERKGNNSIPSLPPNFEWQWETWIKEIADDIEFRGAFKIRPWNLIRVLDTISAVTRAANKPLYYQSDFHSYPTNEGRKHVKQQEVELVKSHKGLAGFVLYETANFTQLNEKEKILIMPYIKKAIQSYFQ